MSEGTLLVLNCRVIDFLVLDGTRHTCGLFSSCGGRLLYCYVISSDQKGNRKCQFGHSELGFYLWGVFFGHFAVPVGISPMGKFASLFSRKNQLQQSRVTNN